MAQNDNSMGAPTEGLGQNVTFAFDPGGMPNLQIGGKGKLDGGVRGGDASLSTQGVGVRKEANPTIEMLMRVGDELLKPQLEKKRTEAFVSGMQRAMSGEAVKDIAANQPWYSKVFGDSDVVEGARAYAGHTVAQTTLAAMEDQMPEIRKMGPQEAQRFFVDAVNKNLTGDKATDLSIMKAMTQALPGVMRQQTKQHYGYLQETAATAEAGAFNAGADAFQKSAKRLSDGYMTQDEYDAQAGTFVRSLVPAQGRDMKGWRESMSQNLEKWATNGNFHALNAVKKAGLLEALTPDQQMGVKQRVETEERALRSRYSYEWTDEKAQIEALAHMPQEGQTATVAATKAEAMNERYRKLTGSSIGIFSPEEMTALTKGSAIAITQEKNRQAALVASNANKAGTAAAKAQATEDKYTYIRGNLKDVADIVANPGFSNEDVTAAVIPMYNQQDPQGRLKMLSTMYESKGYVLKLVADGKERAVEALVSGGDDTVKKYGEGAQAAYAEWKQMHDFSPEMAGSYYGKQAPRLAKMDQLLQAGLKPETAWTNAMLQPLTPAKTDAKVLKATAAAVLKQQPGWVMGTLSGEIPLTAEAQQLVANMAGHTADQWHDTQTPENAAKIGIKQVMRSGQLTVLGGHAWAKQKGQPDLAAYLAQSHDGKVSVPTDTASEVVHKAIDVALYGADGIAGIVPNTGFHVLKTKATSVNVYQTQDETGQPALHILANIDGDVRGAVLPFNRVFELYHKHKEDRSARGVMRNGTNRQVMPFVGGDTRETAPTN